MEGYLGCLHDVNSVMIISDQTFGFVCHVATSDASCAWMDPRPGFMPPCSCRASDWPQGHGTNPVPPAYTLAHRNESEENVLLLSADLLRGLNRAL